MPWCCRSARTLSPNRSIKKELPPFFETFLGCWDHYIQYLDVYLSRKRTFDGIQPLACSSAFNSHFTILSSRTTDSPQYSTNKASSSRIAASCISDSISCNALCIYTPPRSPLPFKATLPAENKSRA